MWTLMRSIFITATSPFPNSHWMRVSETTCLSALIKLVKHTVHLRWLSRVLWPRPVQKGFSKSPDHPIFKRQEMNEAATSPKESPHPSFQPKYFVLCLCLLVYTSLHIYVFSTAKSLGQPNFPATYVSVLPTNTDPQCQHYKHHLRRCNWEKHHQGIKQNTS